MEKHEIIFLDNNKFDFSNIKFSELYETKGSVLMKFICLNNKRVVIKTGPIKMNRYGIPRLNNKHYPDDKYRSFIKIPLDPTQISCNNLKNFLIVQDMFFSSDNTKNNLFGTEADKYQYYPKIKLIEYDNKIKEEENHNTVEIINIGMNNFNDFNNLSTDNLNNVEILAKRKYISSDYCKVKIAHGLPIAVKYNGQKFFASNITDIEEYIKFGSIVTFQIFLEKVWFTKNPVQINGKNKYLYGVGLKMYKINIDTSNIVTLSKLPIFTKESIQRTYKKYLDNNKKYIDTNNTNISLDIEI